MNGNGWKKWLIGFLTMVLLGVQYAVWDKITTVEEEQKRRSGRIARLEAQVEQFHSEVGRRVERIEIKLDKVLEKK